jgi:hypothetical protein
MWAQVARREANARYAKIARVSNGKLFVKRDWCENRVVPVNPCLGQRERVLAEGWMVGDYGGGAGGYFGEAAVSYDRQVAG